MLRNSMLIAAVVLLITAGCNDGTMSPTGGAGGQTLAGQMADVALDSDMITERMVGDELDALDVASASRSGEGSGTVTQDITFSRTRPCPGGGQIQLEGSIHRTKDLATGVMEAEAAGSRTRNECTFQRREFTIVVNSSAQWDKFRRRIDGVPDGLQTSYYEGSSHAVRSDGEERSCEFEITIVRDPEAHTRTLDGMICGTEVHRSVTWSYEE